MTKKELLKRLEEFGDKEEVILSLQENIMFSIDDVRDGTRIGEYREPGIHIILVVAKLEPLKPLEPLEE